MSILWPGWRFSDIDRWSQALFVVVLVLVHRLFVLLVHFALTCGLVPAAAAGTGGVLAEPPGPARSDFVWPVRLADLNLPPAGAANDVDVATYVDSAEVLLAETLMLLVFMSVVIFEAERFEMLIARFVLDRESCCSSPGSSPSTMSWARCLLGASRCPVPALK